MQLPQTASQRQLLGQLKTTFEQVRQVLWQTTCPGHTPGLWQSGEGSRADSHLPHHYSNPWTTFGRSVGFSPVREATEFRAAHTPPCWPHWRSALPAAWPTATLPVFWLLQILEGNAGKRSQWHPVPWLEVLGLKYPSPMCFDSAWISTWMRRAMRNASFFGWC